MRGNNIRRTGPARFGHRPVVLARIPAPTSTVDMPAIDTAPPPGYGYEPDQLMWELVFVAIFGIAALIAFQKM